MGFDPRRWRPPPAGSRPVTANVEALLAENEALRREVLQLREQLERWRRDPDGTQGRRRQEAPEWDRVSHGQGPAVSPSMVERWMAAMACHSGWEQLRIGPPGGLRGLVERCRSRSWNPALSLEQELDRRQSGLGSELQAALRGPHSRGRW
ncbi:MAG: molecular chaperone DnaJ, partial [Cyanobium sp.]